MLKYRFHFSTLLLVILFVFLVFIFATGDQKSPERDYRIAFQRNYRILTPEVPSFADFAGEEVPMNLYYVHESLEREILAGTYMHTATVLMFKRANRWFPVIEPILKQNNIPDDFKYLALAESNLSNAVSPSNAEGFWQFLNTTGKKYGLEITEEVDERYNVEKSTEAACQYFREAYQQYGSWTLAAASFNRGVNGLSDALKLQKVHDFYDLYLIDETSRYIFRILALKEIYNHPTKYGFFLHENDFYPVIPVHYITIDSPVTDLPALAFKLGVNYRILREFNPWLRRYTLPNKNGKRYQFIIPDDGAMDHLKLQKRMPESSGYFHDTLKINSIH
jgi:hypothetical protein